ncbi:hypothetical protein BH23BAC3_BH23BAC3_33870 [soil metagenome]
MNQNKQESYKSKKRGWLILAASVMLVLGALVLAISIFAEPMLKDRLEQEANQALGPEMELVIGDLSIGYLPLSVTVRNVDLIVLEGGESDIQWPNSNVESIKISGIGLRDFIFEDDLNISTVEINRAILHLVPDLLANIESGDTDIKIGRISLYDSQVNIYPADSDDAHTVIGGIRLSLTDLNVSSDTDQMNEMVGSLDLQVRSASHVTEDGYYEVRSSDLRFNLDSRELSMETIAVIPLLSPHELPASLGHETDHFDISSQHVSIRGIDIDQWFESEVVSISVIELNDLILEISRDKNHPDKPRTAVLLLNEQFANLDIETSIGTLLWKGGYIMYREMEEGQDQYGEILFDAVDIEFFGIQNVNPDETIKATASCLFMGLSELNVDFEFFLENNAAQNISGSLGQIDLKELNTVLEPLAFVKIKEGDLKSMTFEFTADDNGAKGELMIIYDNLTIRILDEENLEQTATRNVASFFANLIAIRSSNSEDDPRMGEIALERDEERSMFTYWWHILRDGLMSSVARV